MGKALRKEGSIAPNDLANLRPWWCISELVPDSLIVCAYKITI